MEMKAVLDRITARREALGMSEAALSARAGSRDLIRNWRRAMDKGQDINARHDSLEAIARALNVTVAWLTDDAAPPTADRSAQANGMAETAAPYAIAPQPVTPDDPQAILRALWGRVATTPATFRLAAALPAFGLGAGDVLVADLARLPQPGELALVTMTEDDTASAATMVCRYLPPFLTGGSMTDETQPLRVDRPGVTVRYPIIGALRGLP